MDIERFTLAFDKLIFCIRVSADPHTWLRLLANSKRLHYFQKKNIAGSRDKTGKACVYGIRYFSRVLPIYLRTYAGDIRIFYEIFWEKIYWLPASFLSDPKVIIDAGANIGMAGSYFSAAYPRARIYCIEPDPDNILVLKMNLSRQLEEGSVVLAEMALYDNEGWVNLGGEGWAYNHAVRKEASEGVLVPATTMEGLIRQWRLEKIDLLKMDIEGAEENLFRGELGWLNAVETILLEIHTSGARELIKDKLTQRGFHWRPWNREGRSEEAAGDQAGCLFLASRKVITSLTFV